MKPTPRVASRVDARATLLFTQILPTNVILWFHLPAKMVQQVHDDKKFTGVRLPTNIKPVHYDLTVKPDFEKFTFQGTIRIDYTSREPATSVVINSYELVIKDGFIQSNECDENRNPLTTVTYSKKSETATLEFRNEIASTGKIVLDFNGTLSDNLKGFYRTSFKIDNQTVYAATTHFEPAGARCSFPCWDEPAIRATFSISLKMSRYIQVEGKKYEQVALSNMPESSRSGDDESVEVKFEKTPVMSTYLVAFIIGPFEAIEGTDSRRPIRVFTRPGMKELGKFSLDVACQSLPYYEDYFGVPYSLPKMDLIAIPDFPIGAMENWGLVTYRETCLLVDPKNTSTGLKRNVALVVAHELSHQWFGNLVTIEWWTHLWLKEGFATFIEYLCVDHIFPEYDIWKQFMIDVYAAAMEDDSLQHSHPIEVPVQDPKDLPEIFDSISYMKGASIIRMLYQYIGDDCFRKGMKDYLNKFAFKHAATEDLWDCLEAVTNKPVRYLMSSWTSQKNYPVLKISSQESPGGESTRLTIRQEKFLANGQVSKDDKAIWMIPIMAITSKNQKTPVELCLLNKRELDISFEEDCDWYKLNPGVIGLYRVCTGEPRVRPPSSSLKLVDRLGALIDNFALTRAGEMRSDVFLRHLREYVEETDHIIWYSIDYFLGQLNQLLANSRCRPLLYAFGRNLYSKIFAKLTWHEKESENEVDGMTRALVINRLVSFGDDELVEEALSRFDAHMEDSELIPANLRFTVYKAVAEHGDSNQTRRLLEIYRSSDLQEEKVRAAMALGYSGDKKELDDFLQFVMSAEFKSQDLVRVLSSVGVSKPQVAWDFFQRHGEQLSETFGGGVLLSRIVKCCTENLEGVYGVKRFFEAVKVPGVERTVQQSIELIQMRALWKARDEAALLECLKEPWRWTGVARDEA